LYKVLSPKKEEEKELKSTASDSYDTLLLKTCQLIGAVERIEFKEGFANASETWSPLKKILRASNIRSRKIILDKQWWLYDHGPFLAFLKEDNTPVALLRRRKKYVLSNLKTGEEKVVTASNASQI